MKFKNFILDQFQEDAIKAIERNHSVVVSAATGTGKTLIADYVIDKYLSKGLRIIYTAPIKALSNQKLKDFSASYGVEQVGIMTGDVVVRPNAPVLVMTTEIYRNMLLSKDPLVDEVSYVVFDEIHYMNDPERGTVWEESIIFSPPHIRFLCLSATIPNASEFGAWVEEIKQHPVEVIRYEKRAVPLEHLVYEKSFGIGKLSDLKEVHGIPDISRRKRRGRGKERDEGPKPREVILAMHDKLPAIVFSFSRKACENFARDLIRRDDFVKNESDRKQIIEVYRRHFTPEVNRMRTTHRLKEALLKGVGFHHAGLLPQHKEAVEELFGAGLLQVLFATETFSVGINMPAKMVIFSGLRKYDGRNFRMINSKEYFQLAGRAGRRGIDTKGFVVAMLQPQDNITEFEETSEADTDPIKSQFQLSINTVINIVSRNDQSEFEPLLKSNFDFYLKKKQSERQVRIMASFNHKIRLLQKMGYLDGLDLTMKGYFARNIYFEELLISEIFASSLHKKLSPVELLQLIAGVIYEQRSQDHFSFKGVQRSYEQLLNKIRGNSYVKKQLNLLSLKRMMGVVGVWAGGGSFGDMMALTSLAEGDIIRLFRRIIDMLGQIRHATQDEELQERIKKSIALIDRDLIAVEY